ncbi:MAG: hypothetical protein PHV08_05215 [Sulfurovaceae bacterium]|nr:hypothetical protein [Sulfurovaceae bacterium]
MKKQMFLDTYIFAGLTDLNDGFDAKGIRYFSEEEFAIVLERVERFGIAIDGIEQWKDGNYYDCKVFELHAPIECEESSDPRWYKSAFDAFAAEGEKLLYAASYEVPEHLIK